MFVRPSSVAIGGLTFGDWPDSPGSEPAQMRINSVDGRTASAGLLPNPIPDVGLAFKGGGNRSGGRFAYDWWLWPLPGPDGFTLNFDCPALRLRGELHVPGEDLIRAAGAARPL